MCHYLLLSASMCHHSCTLYDSDLIALSLGWHRETLYHLKFSGSHTSLLESNFTIPLPKLYSPNPPPQLDHFPNKLNHSGEFFQSDRYFQRSTCKLGWLRVALCLRLFYGDVITPVCASFQFHYVFWQNNLFELL